MESRSPLLLDLEQPKIPTRARSQEIDLLRILCASLLFYFHVGIYTHWFLSDYATYASGTFIALAGYCAVRYSRYREALKHPTVAGVWRYFLDRFLAVYPAYAAITLLVFAGSFLYPAVGHTSHFTVAELLCNLLMLNQYLGVDYFTTMMWFVPFVLQLYLLMPLLCRLAARAPRLGLVACSVLSLLACLSVDWIAPGHLAGICKDWSPIFRLAPAFFGVAVALSTSTAALPGLLLLWIACSAAELALLPWLHDLMPVAIRSFLSAALFPLLFGIVWLAAQTIRRWTPALESTITLLSKATLPFFLGHGVMISFLSHHFGSNPWIWAGYFLFSWAWSALFIVAYLRIVTALRNRLFQPAHTAISTGLSVAS